MPFGFRGRRGERSAPPVAVRGGASAARDGAAALDVTDEEMKGTTRQIVDLTVRVGRAMGMSEEELKNARLGAFLHDIGMISVPDEILFKAGPLTEQEWRAVREHPTYGYELLSRIPTFAAAVAIPYCRHEKWDGTGYPRGLTGDEIPLAARIFAVVDVWVALRSERPFRKTWTSEEAIEYLQHRARRDFDPRVVEVFLDVASAV